MMDTHGSPSENQSVISGVRHQLRQFQQKIDLCSQSFVVKELVDTLQEISRKTQKTVRSKYSLRSFVERMQGEKENSVSMDKEVMYATWFLENLAYLKNMNTQFNERIYRPLTQLFNGDNVVFQRSLSTFSNDSYKDKLPEIAELYKHSDIENVFTRLRYLKDRLDHLLEDEGEVDPALFSVTSAQALEGIDLPNNSFIRLMPDIQQKMATAAILAERMLQIATTKDANGGTMISKLERVKTVLGSRLDILNREIENISSELSAETDELQDLLAHEDKSSIITNRCQSLELRLSKLNEKIFQNAHQIDDIEELLDTEPHNKQFVANLKSDLCKKKKLHEELTRTATIVQFEHKLVTEDLCVELELKPSIIRFTSSVQDTCEQLELELEAKRLEKHQLEMALKPVPSSHS